MKFASLAMTVVLLTGIAWETSSRPRPEDAAPFHRQIKDFFDAFPYRSGPWIGTDNAPTPAAQTILRPNVLISRAYRHSESGRQANLLFVQCRDSRDMSGHYPPVCYPAHGWEKDFGRTDERVRAGDTDLPMSRYTFERSGFNRHLKIVIYQFFILPGRGYATTMDAVREAGSDYPTRALGAAQVQVVMDSGLSAAEEREIVDQLLTPLTPVFSAIANAAPTSTDRTVQSIP